MSYEDRDDRLKRVISQCYIRKWAAESPNGGMLGLPTTVAMIAVGILFASVGVKEFMQGSTGFGTTLIASTIVVCTLEIIWRNRTIRTARRRAQFKEPVDFDYPMSGLDIGMIMSPLLSFSMLLCGFSLGLYILASVALTSSKQPRFGSVLPLMFSAFALINIGAKQWHFYRATRRIHAGQCILCDFAVQPDMPLRIPLDATYTTTQCRDCGHFVPIVVTDTAITENIQA